MLIGFVHFNLFAQEKCGSSLDLEKVRIHHPAYYQKLMQIEQHTQNYITQKRITSDNVTATIPVVVHIIHNGEAIGTGTNLSVAQIQSQIDVLNEDFRRLNADRTQTPSVFVPVAADVNIEFRLACTDPNGNATNGIIRVQGNNTSYTVVRSNGLIDDVATGIKQNSTAWRNDWYLNIWVCNLNGGVAGYTPPPGGNAAFDGVVVENEVFGRIGNLLSNYNKGRTTTHEVGHWFNLRHIWGDDENDLDTCGATDFVADTPNQSVSTFGCPSFPQVSCNNAPNGNMFMNYMDYTDDRCMNMFTNGQKDRMRALFAAGGARESFISLAIRENTSLICSSTTTFSVEPNTGATVNYQ